MNPFYKVDRWLEQRPWRIFAYCLPAVLAMGMLVLVLVLVFFSTQKRVFDQRYTRLTQSLLRAGKYEEARVASMHGLLTTPNDLERAQKTFYLGLALNGLGRKEEAAQLFSLAAPLDHPGSSEAQLLMARTLLSSTNLSTAVLRTTRLDATNATTEMLHIVERHLLNALASDSQSLEANDMLGRFYINTHNPAKAQKYLMKIYSARPETALLLAITCVQTNDQVNALRWADRAISAYEQDLLNSAPHYLPEDRLGLVQSLAVKQMYAPQRETVAPQAPISTNAPPQDSPEFWLDVVRLLMVNGKYAPALDTLEQQMLINSNSYYASAISQVCASWAQSISPAQKEGAAARLKLIEKGLANAPHDLNLQLLLVQATHVTDDSGPAAKKLLDELIAGTTGESAAWWHFVLWTDSRIRGDLPTARQHLQTAYQLAPQIPEVRNDLAMDLSTGGRHDQENALKIIQSLLDQFPNASGFRDTRGQILAKLGRYEEAITDLEYAIPRQGNPASSRQALAQCYAALGRTAPVPQAHVAVLLGEVRNLVSEQKYAEALGKLESAMHESPNAACASVIADTCVTWAKTIPVSHSEKRLQLIQKGLTYVPDQPELKQMLLQATHAEGAPGLAAKQLLNQLVATATSDAAAEWHLTLGQDARLRGDLAVAQLELQTAYKLAPERTQIKIELASVLVAGNHADWEQGLKLVQPAVDEFPDNPEFRSIHGLLLARLGQNKAAAADLEFAAAKLSNPTETRLALAKVYDALGKPKLAEQQRRLAVPPANP